MSGSKKGACSAHIQAAKANCLEHARRDFGEKNRPGYIMTNRTMDNVTVFEHEMVKARKSIRPLIRQAEKLYTEKTGQKCQKSFTPFREDVLSLPGRGDITTEQLMAYKAKVEGKTGWQCYGMWYHKDEGYMKSKHIEGEEGVAINFHVHCLWYCQDPETGKARRNDRQFFKLRQDWLAEATGMERGNPAAETGIERRSAMEQRIYAQEQRLEKMESMTVAKAAKEKALGILGQSKLDKQVKILKMEKKELETKNKSLQATIDGEPARTKAAVEKVKRNEYNAVLDEIKKAAGVSGRVNRTAIMDTATDIGIAWKNSREKAEKRLDTINQLLRIPAIRQCVNIIHSAVKKWIGFNGDEVMKLSETMGDNGVEQRIENAERLYGASRINSGMSLDLLNWKKVLQALRMIAEYHYQRQEQQGKEKGLKI